MRNKKKLGLILLGLVVSLCTLYPAYGQEDAVIEQETSQESSEIKVDKETPDKAMELMKNKDYEAALPLLNAYINSKPKKYLGYKLRGEVYYALRQYDLAVQDFQKAIDIKTDNDKFATGTKVIGAVVLGADKQEQYQNPELGVLYAGLMYAQKAVNNNMYEVSYKKALEYNSHQYLPAPKKEDISKINCPQKYGKVFNPQGIDADIAGVIEDIENGHFYEAVYKLPKITTEYPNYYLGQYLSGVVMYGLEHQQEAITAFNNSIKLNPNDFESYASLGLIYYQEAAKTFNKDYAQKSIDNFKKAIALNPNCHTYYFYIGLNQLDFGDYDEAVGNFKKALTIKNNDYNSMYYKSIAQYLQKDYNGTVEETTRMLYRHVSNYNSVLYLRSLAYYKLKNEEAAIADIEKIHQNMNDIYNIDIKNLSEKENVLVSYLYYLQSLIARDSGMGAKSDLQKAYQNPLIALLDTRSSDFAQANFKLTSSDIETQYEYLITTFSDFGIGFEYLNPDYKIVSNKHTLPDSSEKIAIKPQDTQQFVQNLENVVQTEEIEQPVEPESGEISQSVEPLIDNENQNDFLHVENVQEKENPEDLLTEKEQKLEEKVEALPQDGKTEELEDVLPEGLAQDKVEALPQDGKTEELEDVLPEGLVEDKIEATPLAVQKTIEKEIPADDTAPVEENKQADEVSIIPVDEQSEKAPDTQVIVYDPDTLIFAAPEQKSGLPVVELRNKVDVAQESSDTQNTIVENKPETNREPVPADIKTLSKAEPSAEVNEKFANVNLDEFEIKNKKVPELKEDDEVIFFEPESFLKKQEKQVKENLNNLSLIPASNIQPKEEKLVLPSVAETKPEKFVDVNITKESDSLNLTPVQETISEINLIEVADIEFPKVSDKNSIAEDIRSSSPEESSIIEIKGENIGENSTVNQFLKEEISDENILTNIVIPDKVFDEILVSTVLQDVTHPENLVPEIRGSEPEISEMINDQNSAVETISEETPKKKAKKSKKTDNLIIAVGGNPEEFIIPEEKNSKTKKKIKKDKLETSEITEVMEHPIPVDTKQADEISSPEEDVSVKKEEEVKEIPQNINVMEEENLENNIDKSIPEELENVKPEQAAEKSIIDEPEKSDIIEQKVENNFEQPSVVENSQDPQEEEKFSGTDSIQQAGNDEEAVVDETAGVVNEQLEQLETKTLTEPEKLSENEEKPAIETKEVQNEVSSEEVVTTDDMSEKTSEIKEEQKVKKVSFWKRIFSRKKNVSNPETTQEIVPETPVE